ncbi:hypothetical protein MM236_04990 [Belliella sp. DSM 107340]|uniref:Uncharacterized protein n=1 Tax=Belliella calami TaxID=2923436 RepID=A0ABS9UMC2_9BACT|nr:hypothetical protein [Belliella calami]MCH7397330.1 hypothetical protein [Belliella calami]
MMVGLLFFASCQELKEEPLAKEPESLEQKFDRLKFLSAVNKATNIYQEEARNSKKGKNFRSIYDSENRVERYIGDIADALETPNFSYNVVSGNSWDAPIQGNSNIEEYTFDQSDLPINVRRHVIAYENKIDNILSRYENNQINDNQLINEIKSASTVEGNLSKNDPSLTLEDREALSEIFYSTSEMALPIHELLLLEGNPTNAFFKSRLGRAFGRILLAVVATAVVVAVPVAAVAVAKTLVTGMTLSTVKIGVAQGIGKIVAASLTKGVAIGGATKVSGALLTGLYAGVKSAGEKWDTEWKGIKEETKALVKIKLT